MKKYTFELIVYTQEEGTPSCEKLIGRVEECLKDGFDILKAEKAELTLLKYELEREEGK